MYHMQIRMLGFQMLGIIIYFSVQSMMTLNTDPFLTRSTLIYAVAGRWEGVGRGRGLNDCDVLTREWHLAAVTDN